MSENDTQEMLKPETEEIVPRCWLLKLLGPCAEFGPFPVSCNRPTDATVRARAILSLSPPEAATTDE